MSNQYSVGPQTVRVSAGTAVKIGFFAALGAALFSILLSIIVAVIAVLLASEAGIDLFDLLASR
jgi:hypothetical protein